MNKFRKLGPIVPSLSNNTSIEESVYEEDEEDEAIEQREHSIDGRKSWLNNDLASLKENDLKVQLEAIFGGKTADAFLNPKMKDKPRKTLDKKVIRMANTLDAHELWSGLRNQSDRKLERNMAREQHALGTDDCLSINEEGPGDEMVRIDYEKQQLELMHRIAHVNEAKMKQLLNTVQLPRLSGELPTDANPLNYCHELPKKKTRRQQSQSARSLESKDSDHIQENSNDVEEETPRDLRIYDSNFRMDNKNVLFVTEKGCTYQGQFRERIRDLGIESNLGIAKSIQPRSDERTDNASIDAVAADMADVAAKESLHSDAKTGRSKTGLRGETTRQPLTVTALTEYCRTIPVPGEGDFKAGKIQLWNGGENG